jgi:AP2-associated kinase
MIKNKMFSGVLKTINKGINKLIGNSTKYNVKGKDYYEQKLLAEGGFGYVYMVEDESGNKYALKKMYYHDKEGLTNIKRELDNWKKVSNHANIIKLVDYDIGENHVFILMELASEGTLLEMINDRPDSTINENLALLIIKEVSCGLNHMHSQEKPIAHRDIKIENVLKIGNNYKICDFGSSSTETLDPRQLSRQAVLDCFSKFEKNTTFMYRPPEMCDPYSKYPINEKVDIWMLGCILYALLFKLHPFQDAQKLTIINAHYYIPQNNYSDKIIDFLRLLLTPNPIKRPSAKDVITFINNWNNVKNVDLPEETKIIKEKQNRNQKTNKTELLSADDILRVQQEILNDQKKKNKNKRKKDDDDDLDGIFEDMDLNQNEKKNNQKYNQSSQKPFDGFSTLEKSNNANSNWMIDFNQPQKNEPVYANQNVVNNFDFDFITTNQPTIQSTQSKKNDSNVLNDIFSNPTNNNFKEKKETTDFGDFVFTNQTSTVNSGGVNNFYNNQNSNNKGFDFDNKFDNKFINQVNNSNNNNKFTNFSNNNLNKQPQPQQMKTNFNNVEKKPNGEQNIYDFFK